MFYVIEFDEPIGNPQERRGQARFYSGYCDDQRFSKRMAEHQNGTGAALTRHAVQSGVSWRVVIQLPGKGRDFERWWKRQKNTPKLVKRYRKLSES